MADTATVFERYRYYKPDADALKEMSREAKLAMGRVGVGLEKTFQAAKKPAAVTYQGASWALKMLYEIMMSMWRGVVNVCRALCGMDSIEKQDQKDQAALRDVLREANARGDIPNPALGAPPGPVMNPAMGLPMPSSGGPSSNFAPTASVADKQEEHQINQNESVVFNAQEINSEKMAMEMASRGFLELLKRIEQTLMNDEINETVKDLMETNQGQEAVSFLAGTWSKEIVQGESLVRERITSGLRSTISQHYPDMEDLDNKVEIIVSALPENIAWEIFQNDEIEGLVAEHLNSNRHIIESYLPFRTAVSVLSSAQTNDYEQFSHYVNQLMEESSELLGDYVDGVEIPDEGGGRHVSRNRETKGA